MINLFDRDGSLASARSTSAAELHRRQRVVSETAHSWQMDGLSSSPEFRADAEAYADGSIKIEELGRRTRARYGLD